MKYLLLSIFTLFSIAGFAQPVCQSQSSSAITSTSANVTYYVNANGKYTTLVIQYNTVNTDSALSAGPSIGDGAVQSVFNGTRIGSLTGLSIKTKYYWRVVGTNTNGTTKSGILSFTTLGEKPTVTLYGAQAHYNYALVDYDLNTKNDSTTVYIKYGTSANNLNNQYNEPNKFFGSLFTTSKIQGLAYNTVYYYKVFATNSIGTDSTSNQFTSSPMPSNPTITSHTILPMITTCRIKANVVGNYGEPSIRVKYGTAIGTLNNIANGDTLFFGKWDPNPTGTLTADISGLISNTKYYCQIEVLHLNGLTSLIDSFSTSDSNVDTTGLLAYYNFENNFNSHNNVHNLASATPTSAGFTAGKAGQCATFSGSQTLSNTSLATAFNDNEFTVAFWGNRTINGSYASGYELFGSNFVRNRNGNHEFGMAYNSTTFAFTSNNLENSLNAWHHYAFVFKQSGANKFFYYYIDGTFIDSIIVGNGATSLYHFNNVFTVGGGTDAVGTINGLKYFKGKIDELYVYKIAISPIQILAIMGNINGVLPTTITQFAAIKKENTAQLRWITENELNVAHFNIQRSINGKDFETIGKVNAGKNEYNFSDNSLPISIAGNTIYYRLQVLDKDGSNTYSITKQITLNNKQQAINIFPTLATSQVNIEYATTKSETINLKIVDITGKLIDTKNVNATVGNNIFYYDCSKLHTGNYFMIFSTKNELMKTKQFIKN